MCEYSGRLIAWLDHELSVEESTDVAWHVGQCVTCREAVCAYEEVSEAFLVCYEASCCKSAVSINSQRKPSTVHKTSTWAMGGVAAAAAILAAILLVQPPAEKLSIHISSPHAPSMAFEEPPAPIIVASSVVSSHAGSTVHSLRRPIPAAIPSQWIPVTPTVQVALPADALFPPGAVPPGFSFIADVRP